MSCMVMSCIYTIQVTLSDCNDTSAGLSENIKKKTILLLLLLYMY